MLLVCKGCNKVFHSNRRKRQYCSRLCFNTLPSTIASKMGSLNVSKRPEVKHKMSLAKKGLKGELNHAWKGNQVGYYALHAWLYRELGSPKLCSRCGTKTAKKYEWANISGKYLREFNDWQRLCVSCHRFLDGHGKKAAPKAWLTRRSRYGNKGHK